ncbi:MAG TPA: hypothetical protein VEJ18_18495 [Planctomycetota bacterium]|nr:hypothetical protein [Planctomycetota bacterium]
MRTILALALVSAVLGCRSREPDPQDAYDFERRPPVEVDHRVEIPADENLQYIALSVDNREALCGWTSRGEAEEAGRRFEEKHPGLGWYILWRQVPDWK